jgi:hypothetical protein
LSTECVGVVVDPNFGERVEALAEQMPVWIVDTPVNRGAVEILRADNEEPASRTPAGSIRRSALMI